jgi:hypothetical protein
MTFPAFKEWHVIVEALGAGEQILILRKGGIAEDQGGFQVEASRFWLFPTRFHAQLEKTKPAAARWFAADNSPSADNASVSLRYYADIVQSSFLGNWTDVSRLDPHHLWNETSVRERFNWSEPAGLHALVVRVHKLTTPLSLPLTPDMGGCKSWIGLPCAFDAQPSAPVLSDEAFADRLAALSL